VYNISGIQQVGIGVSSIELATNWYAKHFGMNISIFSDEAEASLMAQYTGGKIHKRKANLLMNFEGGGGFEIWQFTSREPAKQPSIKEGDLGISHVHLRTHNVEKASAYFKHKGFKNVFQLEGGIIEYARQVKTLGLENKFIGKNFVFDERRGERISDEIIAQCHQCGSPCDTHVNCINEACHLLFIQCESCQEKMDQCCSTDCQEIIALPIEKQRDLRKGTHNSNKIFKKGRSEVLKFKQ